MKKYGHQGGVKVNNGRQRTAYVQGSTVRKSYSYVDIPQPDQREVRRTKVKAEPIRWGYIFVLAIAIVLVCVVLMRYVKIQSEITNHISTISSLESELNDKKLANDETYTKIMSSVDLEEIKRIAVNELGMKYAKEGQVIEYEGEGNDYVRQYSDIPE